MAVRAFSAVLFAAGNKIRWLLRMIVKNGRGLYFHLFLAAGLADLQRKLRQVFNVNPKKSNSMNWVMG